MPSATGFNPPRLLNNAANGWLGMLSNSSRASHKSKKDSAGEMPDTSSPQSFATTRTPAKAASRNYGKLRHGIDLLANLCACSTNTSRTRLSLPPPAGSIWLLSLHMQLKGGNDGNPPKRYA